MFPKSSFLLIGWKKIIRLSFKWDEKKSNEFFTFGIQVQQMWYSTEGDLHVQFGFAEIYTYNASYPRSFDCCCKYTNHLGLQPSLGSVFKVRWYKGMKVIKLVHIGCVLSYFRFAL